MMQLDRRFGERSADEIASICNVTLTKQLDIARDSGRRPYHQAIGPHFIGQGDDGPAVNGRGALLDCHQATGQADDDPTLNGRDTFLDCH